MSIFKAYDIRGVYPRELDEAMAEKIGAAFAAFLSAGRLVAARDMRTMAPSIQAAAMEGILSTGCDVVDIGLASTPMAYFAIGRLPCDGGFVATASHNPAGYIGFKLCREEARPLSGETGIQDVERIVRQGGPPRAATKGRVERTSVKEDYVRHIVSFADLRHPVRMVVDYANGMGAAEGPDIFARIRGLEVIPLFDELDGTFPNHEANPLKEANLAALREEIARRGADLGVAFDGDADRCAFVDAQGRAVGADLITAILARDLLARHPGKGIIYDLRSSRVVPEEVRRLGGRPVRERVGHSFMKETMRREDCIGGGELSGHFYFAENSYSDCGILACIKVLNQMTAERRGLAEMVEELRRYATSGEVNFKVEDKAGLMEELVRRFPDGRLDRLDGITVEYPDWWCNVRPSNTEPYLRLVMEADTPEILEARRREILAILGDPV